MKRRNPFEPRSRALARSGQSTVEYMLLISVIVIAIVAAAYVFIEPFQQGVLSLAEYIRDVLATGDLAVHSGS